jgi:hypothetical protein
MRACWPFNQDRTPIYKRGIYFSFFDILMTSTRTCMINVIEVFFLKNDVSWPFLLMKIERITFDMEAAKLLLFLLFGIS